MRVLFSNNYDMSRARAGYRAGTYPAHHLYGTAALGDGFEVVDLPMTGSRVWRALNGRTRDRFGDLEQQAAALVRVRRGTVVFGAQGQQLAALALLRKSRLLPVPIVGVIHAKPVRGAGARAVVSGFDHVVAMSCVTRQSLIEGGVSASQISVLSWGPDLGFPGFQAALGAPADRGVVATGKTGRDMPLLLDALGQTGLPGSVYGDRVKLEAEVAIPENVKIVPAVARDASSTSAFTYDHTISDLQRASVVAIPLSERYPLHGLTELADAIACGKPVIVTRAPYFDFDIEEIGCGWWVDPGDRQRWRDVLADAMSDPVRLAEMGRCGRRWAAENWNARLFADGVREIFSRLTRSTA